MKDAAAEDIAARLSTLEGLYFPRAVQSTTASSDQRKSILLDLLRRDPAVFLGKPSIATRTSSYRCGIVCIHRP